MSDGFEYVQNFRILTDWQLRAVASQAAAAEYILELRGTIARIVRDRDTETSALRAVLEISGLANVTAVDAATDLVARYKSMCTRLQECVQRHGLGYGGQQVDEVVVTELDLLKAAKKTEWKCTECGSVYPKEFCLSCRKGTTMRLVSVQAHPRHAESKAELTYEPASECVFCHRVFVQDNRCGVCGCYQACTVCGEKFGSSIQRDNVFPAEGSVSRCQRCYEQHLATAGSLT